MSDDLQGRGGGRVVEGLTKIVGGVLMLWGVRVIPVYPVGQGHTLNDFAVIVLFVTGIWAVAGGVRALARRR
jgi:hypothetical protein